MSSSKTTEVRRRVFLVDDHPMIRERLTQLIERESDLTVCGEASGGPEALAALPSARPDVVVIDISLKDSHGLELIKDIKSIRPELPMLVLSMHDESLYAERALRAGAKGYITKQEATTKVLGALRRLLAGEVYLGEQMVARLLNRCSQGQSFGASPVESLADRELEVFQLIGRGKSTRQIATELRLSVKTVESYRGRIKEKLNIENGNALVQYALQWVGDMKS